MVRYVYNTAEWAVKPEVIQPCIHTYHFSPPDISQSLNPGILQVYNIGNKEFPRISQILYECYMDSLLAFMHFFRCLLILM